MSVLGITMITASTTTETDCNPQTTLEEVVPLELFEGDVEGASEQPFDRFGVSQQTVIRRLCPFDRAKNGQRRRVTSDGKYAHKQNEYFRPFGGTDSLELCGEVTDQLAIIAPDRHRNRLDPECNGGISIHVHC